MTIGTIFVIAFIVITFGFFFAIERLSRRENVQTETARKQHERDAG
jgi:uncharacterized membrane protein